MKKITAIVKSFLQEEDGVTAIEYGLIAALIAVVCIAMWMSIGQKLLTKFTAVDAGLT